MDLAKITRLARKRYHQVIGDSRIEGVIIPVACYVSEEFYRAVCDDELTFFEHWTLLALFGEMAAKRGAIIVFMPVVPDDYFAWCKKFRFENSPQARARYINWLMSGKMDGPGMQIDDKL